MFGVGVVLIKLIFGYNQPIIFTGNERPILPPPPPPSSSLLASGDEEECDEMVREEYDVLFECLMRSPHLRPHPSSLLSLPLFSSQYHHQMMVMEEEEEKKRMERMREREEDVGGISSTSMSNEKKKEEDEERKGDDEDHDEMMMKEGWKGHGDDDDSSSNLMQVDDKMVHAIRLFLSTTLPSSPPIHISSTSHSHLIHIPSTHLSV